MAGSRIVALQNYLGLEISIIMMSKRKSFEFSIVIIYEG
jgi:hypothetical protein